MGDDMGQQKLQETEQRREVTGGQESRAPRVERAQEGRDAEVTAMHARDDGECSESQPVEMISPMEDVSVHMKRGTERVRSPDDDRSREIVMILMSCTVSQLLCEDRFGDAAVGNGLERGLGVEHATGWDVEDDKQRKEDGQCIVDEKTVSSICSSMRRSFDKLIEIDVCHRASTCAACWNELECTRNVVRTRISVRMWT